MTSSSENFLLGKTGQELVLQGLAKDPKSFAHNFQSQFGLRPELGGANAPSLSLLDLLSVSRHEVYRGLLAQLREELLSRIDEMSPEQLTVLLDESFPYISFPELRSIPMKVIRTLKVVPRAFLVELSKDDKYFADAPLDVKRQLWQVSETHFRTEMAPLLSKLKQSLINGRKFARASSEFGQLLDSIGQSKPLYASFLTHLQKEYLSSNDPFFCTVRVQLALSLIENGGEAAIADDAAAPLLLALARFLKFELSDAKACAQFLFDELWADFQRLEDSLQLITEFSLVFACPFVQGMMLSLVLHYCESTEIVQGSVLPRNDDKMAFLVRSLLLGFDVRKRIAAGSAKESPKSATSLIQRFLPIIVDFHLCNLMQLDIKFPESFQSQLLTPELRKLTLHYCLERIQKKDFDSSSRLFNQIILSTTPIATEGGKHDDVTSLSDVHDLAFAVALTDRLAALATLDDASRRFVLRFTEFFANEAIQSKHHWVHFGLMRLLGSSSVSISDLNIVFATIADKSLPSGLDQRTRDLWTRFWSGAKLAGEAREKVNTFLAKE